ncbi:MAG TPA: helix-hairpin-helix domain-containing protein [Kofleriaceae bacterium]
MTLSNFSLSNLSFSNLSRRLITLAAVAMLIAAMGGAWTRSATAAPSLVTSPSQVTKAAVPAPGGGGGVAGDDAPAKKGSHKQISGKLNLNTATQDQLMLLPTVGPSKAERILDWRKKNGGFKRTADLRHVKGFGYKTFKKLEPYLDIKGDTTIAAN